LARLARSFFARHTLDVARDLLGCHLVRKVGEKEITGKIVEVEAYRGSDDPASHSFRGPTKRNAVMWGRAGHVYMFFSYGANWCLNFTTEKEGTPGAVLIRALEPVTGVELMKKNRETTRVRDLTNGPGKLTQALSIDGSFYGEDLTKSKRLYVLPGNAPVSILSSSRIGISRGREHQWRFYVKGNPFVSKARHAPRIELN
jgi:DNA-3-methyladenine glycosylase